jgi:hypothetical protein
VGAKLSIVVVTRETRLEGLKARWGTKSQAKFLLAQAHAREDLLREEVDALVADKVNVRARKLAQEDADFDLYQGEDELYQDTLARLARDLDFGLPVKLIDRSFVPNFDFWTAALVVVVGQDGLVANVAKYVSDLPIVAINPDPSQYDGILLPYQVADARRVVGRVLDGKYRARKVTLAECQLNDGQKMLAFNDFFLGCATHTSARYTLEFQGQSEPQSSSGVLVSTGAGSTGWLSSVFNMAAGINRLLGGGAEAGVQLPWEDRRLVWAVREPFASKHSRATLVAGILAEGDQLVLESLMPTSGVIFSDGIESDFLSFNTGVIARIAASKQSARLVVG